VPIYCLTEQRFVSGLGLRSLGERPHTVDTELTIWNMVLRPTHRCSVLLRCGTRPNTRRSPSVTRRATISWQLTGTAATRAIRWGIPSAPVGRCSAPTTETTTSAEATTVPLVTEALGGSRVVPGVISTMTQTLPGATTIILLLTLRPVTSWSGLTESRLKM